jgi:hypothetical protein
MDSFTEGQVVRMAAEWNAYRKTCPDGSPDGNACTVGNMPCATATCEDDGICSYDESSCEGKGIFELTLVTDDSHWETRWDVKDECDGNKVVLTGGPYESGPGTYVERAEIGNSRFTLTIYDSYGEY